MEFTLNRERFGDLCLAIGFVCRHWRGLPEASRPWGMWLCLHASLEAGAVDVDPSVAPVCAAWFLDTWGLHPRTVGEFLRYDTVVNRQPWSSAPLRLADPPPGRFFGIGLSRVAPYSEGRDFYADVLYGARYGAGWRLRGDVPTDLWRA